MTARSIAEPVTVRFFVPPPELQPYLSSIYLTEVAPAEGTTIGDWLMPEWASLRMADGAACRVALGAEPLAAAPAMMVSGPTSRATRIEIGAALVWGVGILPLGWTRFVGAPADRFADRLADGQSEPALTALAPLHRLVFTGDPAPAACAGRIAGYFTGLLGDRQPVEDEALVRSAHALLLDERIGMVADFAAGLSLSLRTLERFCLRVFGFPPKLLLRRQRFTRSLAQFLLDPSLAWIRTLDHHYVDQAHFVRDFRRFMGMSPSAYAAADKPILRATARVRDAAVGGAVQALHRP